MADGSNTPRSADKHAATVEAAIDWTSRDVANDCGAVKRSVEPATYPVADRPEVATCDGRRLVRSLRSVGRACRGADEDPDAEVPRKVV